MRRVNRMSVPSMMGSLIERGFTIACGTVWWADRSSAAWIRGTVAANNQRHRSAGSLGRAPIRLEVAIVTAVTLRARAAGLAPYRALAGRSRLLGWRLKG